MEPFDQGHKVNPISGEEGTSLPTSSSLPEQNFVQFLNALTESPNPQFRFLGHQAKAEHLEEKEKFKSIPITPYNILLARSFEVSSRLREALISGDNPDPGVTMQLEKPKGTSVRSFRVELSQSERDKYDKIINLHDCSTDSGSIESAQIFSLTDHSCPPQQSPLRITSASTMANTKKDKKPKTVG